MAPIRRYLRISKYSVLECRIYLDNPSDSRWLLNPQYPVLPRVFDAIRPLVLPKLREENERRFLRKKSKVTKDVIAEDDFEVGIFLRESRTRHSLLTRHKTFDSAGKTEDGDSKAIFEAADPANPEVVDSDSDPEFNLRDIPEATDDGSADNDPPSRKRKREASDLLVTANTDEKKLGFNTHYESFNISGWVLCLIISRKGDQARSNVATSEPKQPLMEQWISTQAQGAGED
ncbi:uncharacterized protein N7484_000597 [Penicillium longicatenatum]|uniref:uncharacterized protein n=1 Tax=Penicillium longicatenatum TaxID=1561947 RepID=UPI0025469330|nr:uncharacterized protein N7484_000597 [Penicillium longicatenatum]KAJ5661225.1 hypothetical protein N7484_000597 [Penicillium longicatenatum]